MAEGKGKDLLGKRAPLCGFRFWQDPDQREEESGEHQDERMRSFHTRTPCWYCRQTHAVPLESVWSWIMRLDMCYCVKLVEDICAFIDWFWSILQSFRDYEKEIYG